MKKTRTVFKATALALALTMGAGKAFAHGGNLCDLLGACTLTHVAADFTQAAGRTKSPAVASTLLVSATATVAVAVGILLDKDDAVKAKNDKKIADMGRSLEKASETKAASTEEEDKGEKASAI